MTADTNVTLDDFEPPEYRVGRSTCPSGFPKLNSFHWETDWRPSLACPSESHDLFTCPAVSSSSSSSVSGNNTIGNNSTSISGNNGSGSGSGSGSGKKLTGKAILHILLWSLLSTFIVLRLLELFRSKKYQQLLRDRAMMSRNNHHGTTAEKDSLVESSNNNSVKGNGYGNGYRGYLSISTQSVSD